MRDIIVLHVIQALRGGGAQTLVRELVPRLRSRGIDSRVLCAYGDSGLTEAETAQWSGIVYSETRAGVPRLRYLANLRRRLQEVRPALVHTHTHAGSVWGRAAAVLAGIPAIVHTEHDSVESLPLVERVTVAFLNRKTDAFVVFSERSAELVRRREQVRDPIVIPNGIQIRTAPTDQDRRNARQAIAVDDNRILVGVIASLEPYKNPALAIEAVARLSDETRRSVLLAFFGDGSLRGPLESRSRELGIVDSVRFLGFRDGLHDLLPGLDLFLSTSEREMMPFSYLEAMDSGVPIIGTPHGGTLDLVTDGETGIIVKSWAPELVAAAIEWAAVRPQWRARAATAARQRVATDFNIERTADSYAALYRRILASPSGRTRGAGS